MTLEGRDRARSRKERKQERSVPPAIPLWEAPPESRPKKRRKRRASRTTGSAGGASAGRPGTTSPARPGASRTRKPAGVSLEEWQIALRREFGVQQNFGMKNIGNDPVFSEFIIENPDTGGTYRVAIRGILPGSNYCSCKDFSVNTLGTCKHIEFALARLRAVRGAGKAFEKGFTPPYSSVSLRYGMDRKVIFQAGTECPAALEVLAKNYFDAEGVLGPYKFRLFDEFLRKASKIGHDLRCYEDAIGHIARVRDQARLREMVDRAFPRGAKDAGFRDLLKVALYPYQREGALFAARAGRSILADEMGLGKTIQAIAACEILARHAGIERVLVVCPASLKYQWKGEIEKFVGRSALVIEGLQPARQALYRDSAFYKIVNYDVVHRDRDAIRQWSPDLIILDEAQRIKNWKTRLAQSVKQLESPYAIVLTGTPLENRLEELHSIVEFIDRFQLGPRFQFLHEHQVTDEAGMVVGYRELAKIGRTLAPILLRRTKREVLQDLPERLEKNFFVDMTSEQMKLHEENRETVARIVAKWRRVHFLSETDQRILMTSLQNMRMSCNSTFLLDRSTDYGHKCDELMALLGEIFEDPEAKAVVFSQWLGTHELIVRRLKGNGWGYAYLHGGVPSARRKDLLRRFHEEPDCRLFLSTEAGGVGMNLQCASAVINMELPWNPAVLEQRIGRVHRLGQRRPVRVVNFIATGAIEHGMLSLLGFKKSLFAGVLDGGQDEVFLGGSRLTRFMESVEKATGDIPRVEVTETAGPAAAEITEMAAAAGAIDEIEKALGAEAGRAEPMGGRAGEGGGRAEEGPRGGVVGVGEAGGIEAKPARLPAKDPWAELATAGLAFLEKLGEALSTGHPLSPPLGEGKGEGASGAPGGIPPVLLERDEAGRSYLKLPAPDPGTLKKLADVLYKLSGR
jgi:superfamily II DNA or RNA helicase